MLAGSQEGLAPLSGRCCPYLIFLPTHSTEEPAIINKTEAKISDLNNLKVRLIADVVTGKIDIRDIEVPDFEYVQETGDSSDEDNKDMGDASEDGEE